MEWGEQTLTALCSFGQAVQCIEWETPNSSFSTAHYSKLAL